MTKKIELTVVGNKAELRKAYSFMNARGCMFGTLVSNAIDTIIAKPYVFSDTGRMSDGTECSTSYFDCKAMTVQEQEAFVVQLIADIEQYAKKRA